MCLMAQRRLGDLLSHDVIGGSHIHKLPEDFSISEGKVNNILKKLHLHKNEDISLMESHRWQKLAEIPEDTFQEFIESYNETLEEITTTRSKCELGKE